MDDVLLELEREYCPPLDSALVFVVYSDFDKDQKNRLAKVREVLDPLKKDALAEQFSAFDPSGSSGRDGTAVQSGEPDTGSEAEELRTQSGIAHSENTDLSSVSNDLSSLQLDGASDDVFLTELNAMDAKSKEDWLRETFPTLTPSAILFALKKNSFDFARATDELLNHVYFKEAEGDEKVAAKGVDAFFVDHDDRLQSPQSSRSAKKGKKSKKVLRQLASEEMYSSASSSTSDLNVPTTQSLVTQPNRWNTVSEDISFMSSHANMPRVTAASLYHTAGGSLSTAIAALASATLEQGECQSNADHPGTVQNVAELVADFPSLEPENALALLWLTRPSTASAHELAKALLSPTPAGAGGSGGGIEIIPRYAPIDTSSPPSPPPPSSSMLAESGPSSISHSTASLASSRAHSLAQQAAASRRARSDPLFRAVAGHYAASSREALEALRAARARDADKLVAEQSRDRWIDLHGVGVADAERIARREAEEWWKRGEEERARRRGRGGGGARKELVIVTGVGKHSEGGRARLGPAVAKMLVQEGWKVEVGSGSVVVRGRTRQ